VKQHSFPGTSGAPSRACKPLLLALSVTAALYAASAIAQAPPPANDEATEIDRVRVTGSLIKRAEYDSTSPIQVITADTNISLGQIETAEFLQKSSIAAGATQISHQFGAFVTEGGVGAQTLSLRGLGANRSLVLLDGHRPGPAGTRGQVGAFDLNVLPSSIIQRIELLKDGSSSIYGSDAVAGVANVITRKNIYAPEITVATRTPAHGGGEVYNLSGATGWNFSNGGITLAGEYWKQEPLTRGDRRFLRCAQDMVWDAAGNRIDRVDNSIIGDTALGGCSATNLYANTVIDALTGVRYVPSWDGTTIGLMPGYRPRENLRYDSPGNPQATFTDVLNFPFFGDQYVVEKLERKSVYSAANFSFGAVNWSAEVLYNRRESEYKGFRQFFPVIVGSGQLPQFRYENDPDYRNTSVPSGVSQPVMPFRSESNQQVDFYYIHTGLDGLFGKTWSWNVDASYSRSRGIYRNLAIDASKTGDWNYGEDAPTINYADPGFLSGERMDELVALIGVWNRGKTVYDQTTVTGIVTGELFNLPWHHSGAVAAAIGAEWRHFSINDQPPGDEVWGQSSALLTKGNDTVKEIFAEVELPLLKGLPGVEDLTINLSNRWFDYDSVGDSDSVWKLGIGWQIVPALRLRATKGSSYRAPGLYELYLGDQTAFVGQLGIDPCIDWQNSNNATVRTNCAAAGIPNDYPGNSSSATIVQGGGAGFLDPERSNARTLGLIWTPAFAPLSVALDYYEITVRDQIDELGGAAIIGSCYGSDAYPNNFCNMFTRNPPNHPTAPNKIEEVRASYVNINLQKVRGYDLLTRYQDDLSFGRLTIESQFTWITEDRYEVFDSPLAGGATISNLVGGIGRPQLVGNVVSSLKRGDFTWTWGMDYIHGTKRLTPLSTTDGDNPPYFGLEGAIYDTRMNRRLYHHISVTYDQPKWSLLVGVRNLFDTKPDTISNGIGYSTYGNVPAFATQYDLYGVSLFARLNYKF